MTYRPVFTLRRFDPVAGPGADLSNHPNLEGAKLSTLRHVANGASVAWQDGPYEGTWYGRVSKDGIAETRFCVVRDQ